MCAQTAIHVNVLLHDDRQQKAVYSRLPLRATVDGRQELIAQAAWLAALASSP